jgi:hypothetical protein
MLMEAEDTRDELGKASREVVYKFKANTETGVGMEYLLPAMASGCVRKDWYIVCVII